MKSTEVLYQYTMMDVGRFVEREAKQEGRNNSWESGKGWGAIKLREVRSQYTDNGKLILQGGKEQREASARRLKEHTEKDREIAVEKI